MIPKQIIDQFKRDSSKLKIEISKALFQSHMLNSYHGIAHTVRVMWNAYLIATLDESITQEMYESVLYASLIHDLGKCSDSEGEIHGEHSANLYYESIQ